MRAFSADGGSVIGIGGNDDASRLIILSVNGKGAFDMYAVRDSKRHAVLQYDPIVADNVHRG